MVISAAALALILTVPASNVVAGQEPQPGVVVDGVRCVASAEQTYAIYLPSNYSRHRQWSLLIGFHPGGHGRAIVEKYKAAAEQYGYIVAASNNSRNGPWSVSEAAIKALVPDLDARFAVDPQRVYLTGHSGGARVATTIALANASIAGVIASSAGYPDSQPRSKVTFAVFGTAGADDFNYIEMRMLDRKLTSPHRLAIFAGGHTLPPDDVALDAIEWMELQAMKSGRRTRDEALVSRLFGKRLKRLEQVSDAEALTLLEALVDDFTGLRDVSAEKQRAHDLGNRSDIKKARAVRRDFEDEESRLLTELGSLEACLADDGRRSECLRRVRDLMARLSQKAKAADDPAERSRARRVLGAVTSGASARTRDREYLAILDRYAVRQR